MGGSGGFAGLLLVLRILAVSSDGLSESSSAGLTVHNVYLELKDVSAEWNTLGFHLGLSQKRLDVLEIGCTNKVDLCYRRMLDAWFDGDLNPSWEKIVRSLDQMGQNRLAESIRERYTHGECTGKHADAEVNVGLGNHKERMRKLESEYTKLAYKVMTSMEDKVDLKKVKFWLTQIPVSLKYMQKHFLGGTPVQLISRAESLLEVFGHLSPYWNFLDYGLMEYVVLEFGNDEVRQSMRRYIHKLTMFRKSVTVSEFRKLWPHEMDAPPESSKLVIKLNRTQSELTLQDVEELRLNVAKSYSLANFALMYGALQGGSVVLTWFIPSSIAPQLVRDVKNGGSGFLKEHNITEVSIDGHTIAITDLNGRIWNLVPSMTTPVRFWSTTYAFFLQPGKDIILSCSKTCAKASPPIWFHTLSKDPWLPMSQIVTGPELELTLHQPPVTTDVGYFCCACVGDHPKVNAMCFGVAYMPHVTHFSITHNGKAVSGVHIGNHITVECEVYGFPSHVEIIGHSKITELPHVIPTWYSKMQFIEIPHATINDSVIYTCTALLHASPDLCLMTEHVKRSLVVYAPPNITDMRRLTENTESNIHTDDFTCLLEVPQAPHDKNNHECIVNTAYETKEVSQTVIPFHIQVSIMLIFLMMVILMAHIIVILMVTVRRMRYKIPPMPEPYKSWGYSIPTTTESLKTTEVPTTAESLKTTEVPTTTESLKTTEVPTMAESLKTTEVPTAEESLKTVEISTAEESLKTVEISTTEESIKTVEIFTTEESLKTAEISTTKEAAKHLSLHHISCSSLKLIFSMPAIVIDGVSYPIGIAVNSRGEIAVAESNCISIFTCRGEKKWTFSPVLHRFHGVAFDSTGNILVTDVWSHSIKKFTPEGMFLTAVGRKGSKILEFDCPTGISFSYKYKKVYVCDQWNNRVQILNEDLTFSSSFSSNGSGDGQFKYPCSVAIESNGDTHVVDSWKCCIQVFTPEGRFLREFGKKGSGEGELNYPSSVSIDSEDRVYITERDNHRVSIFTCQGKFVQSFGSEGTRLGKFNEPRGIAVDKHGLVYVSDTFNHRVQGFKKDLSLPTTAILTNMHSSISEEAVDIEHHPLHTGIGVSMSYHQPSSISSPVVQSELMSHMEHPYTGYPSKLDHRQQLQINFPKSPKPEVTIGGVSYPSGIAVNSRGEIAVVECNFISLFTRRGKKFRTFRISSERGQFWNSCGVAFDSVGNILVTDVLSHCIKKFTSEGEFLKAVGRKGSKKLEFGHPTGIGINHNNNKLYVCEQLNNRIQILNEDLTFSSSFGVRGSGGGQFKLPHDVAFDSNGSTYIADSANCCIQVFTPGGKFLRKFGKRGSARGELYFPSSVSIDSNDIVYVTERDNHRVSVFTCQGKFIRSFGTEGEKPGEFNEPCGIAVRGLVYVSDTFNHRVQGFKKDLSLPTTAILTTMHSSMSEDVEHQPFHTGIGMSQPASSLSALALQTEHLSYKERTGTYIEHPYIEHPYIEHPYMEHQYMEHPYIKKPYVGYVPKPFEQLRQDIPKPFMPERLTTAKEAIQATDYSHPRKQYRPQSRRVLGWEHYRPPTIEAALQTTEFPRTNEVPKHLSSVSLSCHKSYHSPTCISKPVLTIDGVSYPSGIAINSRGEIAVAEHSCISIFTSSGEKMNTFRISSELGQLSSRHPCGVTFDYAGNILVTDVLSHCIKKFTPEGKYLTAVGRKGSEELEFSYPTGIGIHHTSTKLYICDRYNHRVQILNKDLTFSSSFGSRGRGEGLFSFPWSVAFDSTGNVYIADCVNHHIQVFMPEGRFVRKFGKKGSSEGELSLPSSVCIDSNDIVYVTERGNHRVSIFNCQGTFIQSFGTKGDEPGEFKDPRAVTVDESGLVYVSDTNNNRVQVFKNLISS